jgi:hypothetical protein
MQCAKCGHELDENGHCGYCGVSGESNVRVLSKEEKNLYDGVTIDETIPPQQGQPHFEHMYTQNHHSGSAKIFMRNWRLFPWSGNWISKLALFLLVMAVVSFIVFIALPVALIGVAIGAVVWIILNFLRQ